MSQLAGIDHIVVLMLENRSFDSMLGALYPKSDTFDGLEGTETNPDANGVPVQVWSNVGTDEATMRIPNPDPVNCGQTSTRSYLERRMSQIRLRCRPWMGSSKITWRKGMGQLAEISCTISPRSRCRLSVRSPSNLRCVIAGLRLLLVRRGRIDGSSTLRRPTVMRTTILCTYRTLTPSITALSGLG